eukprot:gene7554-biopygen6410
MLAAPGIAPLWPWNAVLASYFDIARQDGATIAAGGAPHNGPGGGHYVQPTLVTGARSGMRVAQEEVFGPFLTVIPFRSEDEAIAIANAVDYGLTGYVWTGDVGRALRVADALEAGMIWLNSENVRHLPMPDDFMPPRARTRSRSWESSASFRGARAQPE